MAFDDAALAAADLAPLGAPGELALMRKIAEWPRQVEIAATQPRAAPDRVLSL